MKYQVTLLTQAGTYEEILMDVPVDIEETWEHFLTNKQVRTLLNEYTNYQVIDIDPQIDFKDLHDYNKSSDTDSMPVDDDASGQLL